MTDKASVRKSAPLTAYGGDEATRWENVALRYGAPLRGFFAKRVRNQSDVDDLVQEVFVHLIRRGQGESIEQFEQYLFETAANVLRDQGRRRQVREFESHESLDETVHVLRSDISPERVLLGREAVALVAATLKQMPERTRDVFVLRAFENHKYSEIAQMLGVSQRCVEINMAKALAFLAQVLDGVE
jgi:RNA polymerase sigma factor (sigma-70 family)